MAAPHGSVGTCNVSVSREWDGHGRSVGRSVDARGPVDHASVGLAQVRPNYYGLRNNDSLLLVSGFSASSPPTAVVFIPTRTRPICGVSLRSVGSPGTCSDHSKTKVAEHNNYGSKLFI